MRPPSSAPPPSERLEGDDRAGVLNARDGLHLLVDEMADVGLVLDVELHQEVEVAGGRIDFRSELRVRELVRHLVGLAEVAFDLHEEGDHSRLRVARGRRRQSSKYGCARQEPRPSRGRITSARTSWDRGPSTVLHRRASSADRPPLATTSMDS